MKALARSLAATLCAATLVAQAAPYAWKLPAWMPEPVVPADNPMSAEKVELGRHLFYDRNLSANRTVACASCHQQDKAFSDGRKLARGIHGQIGHRNSMTLPNVAYLPVLTWANPNVQALETQALIPIFGEHPVEMGMAGKEQLLLLRLKASARYRKLFAQAFPAESEQGETGLISLRNVVRAIASFQRSLISVNSPYDRYRYGGERHAISASARRGEALFFGERLECYHCHGGLHFTDNLQHVKLPFAERGFHNTGLYNQDGRGAYPTDNVGLAEFTGESLDMGRFRTPSLRNVAVSAPYMHDGSIATLRDVLLRHYAVAGRSSLGTDGPNPLRSELIAGFSISEAEVRDLLAFLHSLTDRSFLTDPRHADPWKQPHQRKTSNHLP